MRYHIYACMLYAYTWRLSKPFILPTNKLILNLLNRNKVSSPFTDSEFQKIRINDINEIFSKVFVYSSFHGVSENTENYSMKNGAIHSRRLIHSATMIFAHIMESASSLKEDLIPSKVQRILILIKRKRGCQAKP